MKSTQLLSKQEQDEDARALGFNGETALALALRGGVQKVQARPRVLPTSSR